MTDFKKYRNFDGKRYEIVGTTVRKNGLLPPKLAKDTKSEFKKFGYSVRTIKVGNKRQLYIRYVNNKRRR